MTITLYRFPELRANKHNTISFSSNAQRVNFFNNISQKLTISSSDSTIGRIKDISNLNQELTVFNNGRDPYFSYNYVCINTNEKKYYYFVTDFREIGNSQVVYSLKKDTLLTYVTTPTQGVNISNFKALVTREHKPRFNFTINRALYHPIPESGDNTTPKIINQSVYTGARGVRFVYKNRTDSKPVAYPYVENALNVTVQGSDWIGTVYSSRQTSDEPMYLWDGSFYYTYGQGTPDILITVDPNHYIKYHRDSTGLVRQLRLQNKTTGANVGAALTIPNGTDLRIKVSTTNIQQLRLSSSYVADGVSWATVQSTSTLLNFSPTSVKALPLWSAIDQYDAMTDRIVELPFFHAAGYTFYEDGYGIFINLESSLSLTTTALPISNRPTGSFDMTKVDKNKVIGNDPKLYTSQFAPCIYTFNGAAIGIKRERFATGLSDTTQVDLNVFISTLTPSTFNLEVEPPGVYEKEEDNELRATWDVNNEIASIKDEAYTFNQYYKDLDDKQRRIQESAAFRNTALNSFNQVLGITGGMIAGGNPNPVQLGTRAGQATINIAQSFMDLQDQLKMNTIQAKQKYIGMLLSSSQISGGSLDFLKTFYGDKIRLINFGLTRDEFDYWDTVFHKFGYTTLEYKNPNLRTRKYWDYKKMIIDELSSAFINDECIDDIKMRFSEGVTIYHTDSNEPSSIDWEQSKENWEI